MNVTLKRTIITEVENMIDHSCITTEGEVSNANSLHKAILKKYFEAESVIFDSEQDLITMEVIKNKNQTKMVDINVDYNNLSEFLKSCIEEDQVSLRFYKNLLQYYHVTQPLSA